MRFFFSAIGALLVAAGLGSGPGHTQSFPCRYARYGDEKTICHDPTLGQLDQDLAAVYRRVMSKMTIREAERLDKNEDLFVIARHRCGENRACIEQSYRERIQELQSALTEEAPDGSSEQQSVAPERSSRQQGTSDQNPPEPGQGQPKTAAPSGRTNWVDPTPSR